MPLGSGFIGDVISFITQYILCDIFGRVWHRADGTEREAPEMKFHRRKILLREVRVMPG
jgi:hypothetical protein